MVWAVINGLITLALMPFAPKRARRYGLVGQSVVIAVATVAIGYAALWLVDLAFTVDFRFWIVALKLMSAKQFLIFLIYLLPFTAFFVIALHVMHRNFSTMAAGRGALYLTNILALTLGFMVLVGAQYGTLWLTGKLFNPLPDPGFVPLSTIVAIQFVPLLAICAVISTFTWRRTGSSLPGRPDLRAVRHLVRGGRDRHPSRLLSAGRSNVQDGLKVHNGLASARRFAVL